MHLDKLQITDFRNIAQATLEPVNGVNLITGENASGKTSLLESIYYLSHLRSFRTQHVSDLISHHSKYLQLFAQIRSDTDQSLVIGIRRSGSKLEVRADRQPVHRVADIATRFPVQAIHPDSYKLITGSPSQRRQYIDWGVFHVEHGFFDAWQRYRRVLSQRNAALKSRQADRYCTLWNRELHDTADDIHRLRKTYLHDLQPYLEKLIESFFPGQDVSLDYRRGWPDAQSLDELLQHELQKDRLKGYTRFGPHRAEMVIKVDGQSAQNGISRGQQKVLVALLRLAQANQFTDATDRSCVLLYDDLAAELDATNRDKILEVLAAMKTQLFLTAIEPGQLDLSSWDLKKMFHVEQGRLKDLI